MTNGDRDAEIGVDLTALTSFGANLGEYASNVVSTAAERLTIIFADGAQFGEHAPSAELDLARQTYAACLRAVDTQLRILVDTTVALAHAATTIALEYAQTDAAVSAAVDAAARALPPNRFVERTLEMGDMTTRCAI